MLYSIHHWRSTCSCTASIIILDTIVILESVLIASSCIGNPLFNNSKVYTLIVVSNNYYLYAFRHILIEAKKLWYEKVKYIPQHSVKICMLKDHNN